MGLVNLPTNDVGLQDSLPSFFQTTNKPIRFVPSSSLSSSFAQRQQSFEIRSEFCEFILQFSASEFLNLVTKMHGIQILISFFSRHEAL